jgi:hypothetical protein
MQKAGYEDFIYDEKKFRSWGIRDKFDICEINRSITVHKYTPTEMRKTWELFENNTC